MFKSLGIGARLFIAFLGIATISLSSGIISWFIFRGISQAQFQMNYVALPAVAATQRTAQASARLVASAPSLTAARTELARRKQEAELAVIVADIHKAVADAGFSSLDRASVETLTSTVDSLVSNLAVQNDLVKQRLSLQRIFEHRSELTISAATSIIDLSETLVSNSSAGASAVIAGLYGLIDDPALHREAYDALDRLIEQDIYQLDRMSELRLRSSQIGLLINRLTRAIDKNDVIEIVEGFNQHLRVVRRRVASIDDPVRQKQALEFLSVLESSNGLSPWGESLFGQRQKLVDIGTELEKVADANRQLSNDVSRVAQEMLGRSERFARNSADDAASSLNTGVYALIISSLLAIVISGLIVWLYVERSVVRRITNVADAMRRLTAGDLSVEMKQEGNDELRALSEAVTAFRDESKQRRALETERNRTNEELRRHREELQILVTDRTQQLLAEVALHTEARARAEHASQAKSEFLAVMSHEIRTPMTGMLGMVRILRESKLTRQQQKHLAIAASSGEALLGILNSILDYSKIESGKTDLDPVTFSLKETLIGVGELMRPPASEKALDLKIEIDPKIWSWHEADAGKLQQIVFNLVSNAIKFTESGSVTILARKGTGDRTLQWVDIEVSDTGIGISKDDQDLIFESFTQKDASVTRRYGGTGLGLAISRSFAEIMGGTLEVSSVLGQGSTFLLRIPLAKAAKPLLANRMVAKTRQTPASPLNVLVVEDDHATRIVAETFLRGLGHSVTLVGDGFAALAQAAVRLPDLVLMDISLPGIDGPETARRLRLIEGAAKLRIIAMSAHVNKDDMSRRLSEHMDGFVGKPLTPEALDRAIRNRSGLNPVDYDSFNIDLVKLGEPVMSRILDVAEDTLPPRFALMRRHLQNGEFENLALLAHATLSSAASAGFAALGRSAQRLEQAARAADTASVAKFIEACDADYGVAIIEARRLLLPKQTIQESVAPKR